MSQQLLRLAYATLFLIALIAVYVLWSQVGGQSHLDLMPWYIKLVLGGGAAFAVVKATAASVSGAGAWNGGTLKWLGITLVLLVLCGLASYYCHKYLETDEVDQQVDETSVGQLLERPDGEASAVFGAPAESRRQPGLAAPQFLSQRPAESSVLPSVFYA